MACIMVPVRAELGIQVLGKCSWRTPCIWATTPSHDIDFLLRNYKSKNNHLWRWAPWWGESTRSWSINLTANLDRLSALLTHGIRTIKTVRGGAEIAIDSLYGTYSIWEERLPPGKPLSYAPDCLVSKGYGPSLKGMKIFWFWLYPDLNPNLLSPK